MTRYQRITVIIVAALCLSGSISAAADPTDLLRKSYAAESKSTFSGHLVTRIPGQAPAEVSILRKGTHSRMDYLTGPSAGSAIIDDGKFLITLDSRAKTAYVSRTPDPPQHLDLLLANHRPVLIGSAKIADRDCYEIKLSSKYPGNPYKTIWIDKKSFTALKHDRINSQGKLTMSTEYTRVDYSAQVSESLFAIPKGWKTMQLTQPDNSLQSVRKQVGFTPVKPGYAPRGYQFHDYSTRLTRGNCPFAGLRYTNGLNTISVFERNKDCGGRGFGRGRGRGWMHGRGGQGSDECMLYDPQTRMMRTSAGDITVILVGDIAQTEMQKMADSFK